MALPFELFYTVKDESGDTSTVTIPVESALSIADLPAAIEAFGDILEPLLGGAIVAAGAQVNFDLLGTSWAGVAALGSDIEEGARVALKSAEGFLKSLRLPTFLESFLNPDGSVDTTAPEVAAATTAFLTGVDMTSYGGTGICSMVTAHDEELATLESFKEHFTRSRN